VLVMGISIVSFPKPAPPPGFDDDDMVMGGGNKDGSQDRSRSMSKDRKGKDKDKDSDMIRSICIITEYLEQGSLADILYGSNRVADEFWTYELVLTCALQAARGMLYLHSHQPPICHRDLKSSNLVVDDHWVSSISVVFISFPSLWIH
jgi:serine/threonine protein kinase